MTKSPWPDKGEQNKSTVRRFFDSSSRAGVGTGAVLIGLALFLLFRGFGPGGTGQSGSGTSDKDGNGPDEDSKILVAASVDSSSDANPVAVPEKEPGGLTLDEEKALSGSVLTVLIDERSFLLEVPNPNETLYRPLDLTRLIELAKMVKGDTNGIRVRILRRESARASAERQLMADLVHAGLKEDQIIMPREFVP